MLALPAPSANGPSANGGLSPPATRRTSILDPVTAARRSGRVQFPRGSLRATALPLLLDLVEQLRQLAELRTQGVLTDAEFERQKARVLGN